MSSTNKTLTIELSQYISTDKPTYLSDYNGDMLKIDNAIAADRDGIATAQNTADGAVEKADANKQSIDTLDVEINGNPETPAVPGMSQRLTSAEGDIDTLQALIGDGTAIPTGQTVIQGVTNLENSIAPVENSATFGADYGIGDQFNRGGILYEALVPITTGTAFSSLTVNTDYKQADRITKQINDVVAENQSLAQKVNNKYLIVADDVDLARVDADGVKTIPELLNELALAFVANCRALADDERFEVIGIFSEGFGFLQARNMILSNNALAAYSEEFTFIFIDPVIVKIEATHVKCDTTDTNCYWRYGRVFDDSGTCKITTTANTAVPDSGSRFTLTGRKLKLYS